MLNKKDITVIAAPERGLDLNVKSVAERIMKLAVKNSPAFIRANANRAEKLAVIEALKVEIPVLEKELADAQHELEVAKVESESRVAVDPVLSESKNKVNLEWSEASDVENKDFSTLNELQQFMREEYENDPANLPDSGYDKHRFTILDTKSIRIDVGINKGDFNPFVDNLSKYLIADGYDVDVEADLPGIGSADPEPIGTLENLPVGMGVMPVDGGYAITEQGIINESYGVFGSINEAHKFAMTIADNHATGPINEESAKAAFNRYEDALSKVQKGSNSKAKGKELTIAKKEYEDAKIALQPMGEWMLAQANKTLSDVSQALTLPYGYLRTQPNLGGKFISGNVNSVNQISLYIRNDTVDKEDANQFSIEVRVSVDRPNVFIHFTKGIQFGFRGEDIKVFGNSGVLTTATYEKLTQAINASLQSAIDKVVDSLNSTNSGTNEQTNEQAEVEKEAEAAGTEGGGAKGKIESVEELVDIALSRKDGNKAFAEIGEITQDVAEKVKQVTGIDVTGWVHGIDEAAIRHIIKEHGDNLVEESRGQVAVTPQDISRINEIVQNPDSIEKGDPLPNGNETVIYKKTIEGTSIYVQEMRDGRRKLTAKTLWKVRAVPPATVETGLVHTSETSSTQPPQDDKNIPQPKNNAITSVEIEKELEDLKPLIGTRAFDDKIDPLIEKIFAAGLMPDYEPQLVELDRLHGNAKVAKHRGI